MKQRNATDLNILYEEAETVDREIFAEMRSNILLLSGEHYNKGAKDDLVRDRSKTKDSFKLRLVKNHLHKIVRHYGTSILSYAPGVAIGPQNETDLQDQKDAELNQAVYNQHKVDYRLKERTRQWGLDFPSVGELCVFLRWNPNAGDITAYHQKMDENGQPVFDEMGQPAPDEQNPVYGGKFEIEDIFGANLLRDPSAKNMRDAKWLGIRKMVPKKDLEALYKDQPEKLAGIQGSAAKETFVVFDNNRNSYRRAENDCLVKEYYFRKCAEYPEGYFYIVAGETILEEGELPYGIFPIVWAGFDEFPTSCRARSIIKVARPYIAEINRASSQMAMHQITIGDDKILYQKGSKLEQGALLPGVRGISYQGREPTVLQGRDGGQFLAYINSQIQEMYSVLMLDELTQEKFSQMDPMSLLYRAASQQRKFSLYAEKFEQFLVDFVTTLLEMSKHYLPDEALIPAVGNSEIINLAEFRKTTQLRYQIKVEPRADTLESMMGKQLTFQNILQYVGKQLDRDDIGKVLQQMPYANAKEAFADFTIDEENAKNDMLAMERKEYPPIGRHDDPAKMTRKLTSRMRKPDFRFLDPMVQQLYEKRISEYEQLEAEQQQKILAAKNEYIPTDGALVKVDAYINTEDGKQERAVVPQRSLEWLLKQLEAQGNSLARLEPMTPGAQADIAQMMMNGGIPGGAMPASPPAANGGYPPAFGQAG
jgi:hypothetical protein